MSLYLSAFNFFKYSRLNFNRLKIHSSKSTCFSISLINPQNKRSLFISSLKNKNQTHAAIKSKPIRKEIKALISLAQPEKWNLCGAIFLLFVSSSVTMAVPYCIGKIIDISQSTKIEENLINFCVILLGIFAIGALANFGRAYLMNTSSYRIINSLRTQSYKAILKQETQFFDTKSTGELVNILSSDASIVGMSITKNLSDGLRSTFSFFAGSSLMIYTSPTLAFLGLMTVAPVVFTAVIYGKILKRYSRSVQDSLANATQIADERISNIRTVQAFAKLEEEYKLYCTKINNLLVFASKESLSRAIFFGMTGFSGNVIILFVLYFGGMMMNQGQITIGNLTSFLLYAAYVGISINNLSAFYSDLMQGMGAASRIWEILDRNPLIPWHDGITLPSITGKLNFHNVSFAYPSRPEVMVLSQFNLSIPAGSIYAFVGSSGCGKSTVGSLLLRFYECTKGSITIDDENIKSLNLQWLRNNIGFVSQDPILFSFTIRENILYGCVNETSIDDKTLENVLEISNSLEFIRCLPNGLDTVVGERGVMLSGGQRQRIAIARALLKNPKILILDEATSALDSESEYLVQLALEELMKNRTVITIAHRLSTIQNADMIVMLEKGNVVEMGKYQELISKKGRFYHLVHQQNLKS